MFDIVFCLHSQACATGETTIRHNRVKDAWRVSFACSDLISNIETPGLLSLASTLRPADVFVVCSVSHQLTAENACIASSEHGEAVHRQCLSTGWKITSASVTTRVHKALSPCQLYLQITVRDTRGFKRHDRTYSHGRQSAKSQRSWIDPEALALHGDSRGLLKGGHRDAPLPFKVRSPKRVDFARGASRMGQEAKSTQRVRVSL